MVLITYRFFKINKQISQSAAFISLPCFLCALLHALRKFFFFKCLTGCCRNTSRSHQPGQVPFCIAVSQSSVPHHFFWVPRRIWLDEKEEFSLIILNSCSLNHSVIFMHQKKYSHKSLVDWRGNGWGGLQQDRNEVGWGRLARGCRSFSTSVISLTLIKPTQGHSQKMEGEVTSQDSGFHCFSRSHLTPQCDFQNPP